MDNKVFYQMTYGLFLLTAQDEGKDNGCIINTAIQVANNPTRVSIAVIKSNKTNEMIQKTKRSSAQTQSLRCSSGSACSPAGMWTSLQDLRMWCGREMISIG